MRHIPIDNKYDYTINVIVVNRLRMKQFGRFWCPRCMMHKHPKRNLDGLKKCCLEMMVMIG